MMDGYGNHVSGWGWAAMSLGMIVVLGLVIAGIMLLVRSLRAAGTRSAGRRRTPEQVLDMRFAQGEMNEAEYHARLDALHSAVRS